MQDIHKSIVKRGKMKERKNPTWWDATHDSAWNSIKYSLERAWNQRKTGINSNDSCYHQNLVYHLNRMAADSILFSRELETYEKLEDAFRFGYSARVEHGLECSHWNSNFEITLAKEWRGMNPTRPQTWEQDRQAIL